MGSALLAGHGPALCGFLRAAAVPHELRSPAADIGTPFVSGAGCAIVAVDDVEELVDIEEEEFVR
jgi:hypothetical protein